MTYRELDRYRQLKNRIHYIEVELRELAELSAVRLDGMPRSGSSGNPTYQAFCKAEKLREQLMFQRQRAVEELQKLNDFIESVDDVEMQNILTARFVEGKTYEEIGEELYMHQSTVHKKLQRFLKIQRNQNGDAL